jgi:hypothetical protein
LSRWLSDVGQTRWKKDFTTEAQRHGENTGKKAAARLCAASSSPVFEITEVAEVTEKLDWPRASRAKVARNHTSPRKRRAAASSRGCCTKYACAYLRKKAEGESDDIWKL